MASKKYAVHAVKVTPKGEGKYEFTKGAFIKECTTHEERAEAFNAQTVNSGQGMYEVPKEEPAKKIDHVVTQDDIDGNPDGGLILGETIQIPVAA